MAVFAKDEIEVRNLQKNRNPLVEPTEPVYEVEITGETDAQRKNRAVRNQEKRVGWESHVMIARDKGTLFNSFRWDEADAKVGNYIFLCLGAEGQRQLQQKRPSLVLPTVTTREIITIQEGIVETNRIIAFERYNFSLAENRRKWKDWNNFTLIWSSWLPEPNAGINNPSGCEICLRHACTTKK